MRDKPQGIIDASRQIGTTSGTLVFYRKQVALWRYRYNIQIAEDRVVGRYARQRRVGDLTNAKLLPVLEQS